MSEQIHTPEQEPQPIAQAQLKEVTAFVVGAADHGRAGMQYDSAMRKMSNLSEHQQIDELPGHIALTAAALGSTVISKVELAKRGQVWASNLEQMGLQADHVQELYSMQHDFARAPGSPDVVGGRLSQGMSFLKARAEAGEQVEYAKLAFLSSAFSATRNPNLRSHIYRDLQQMSTAG